MKRAHPVQTTNHTTETHDAALSLDEAERRVAGVGAGLATLLRPIPLHARARTLKMRTGGEVHVAAMAHLVTERPSLTEPTGADPEAMQASVELAKRLDQVATVVEGLARKLRDTALAERADAWGKTLAVYRVAQSVAPLDADVTSSIAAMAEFLRPHAAHKPATVTTSPAPTAMASGTTRE